MIVLSRKKFLSSSVIWLSPFFLKKLPVYQNKELMLSFSTIGCPDWDLKKIIAFAAANGYKGIEIRGLQRELDLTICKEFIQPKRNETLSLMEEHGLQFVCLGSSANLHHEDPAERKENLDLARRFIDLANGINSHYVRVFPNNFPEDQEKSKTFDLIIGGLLELADYAKDGSASVLMETHGDLVQSSDLEKIMVSAEHPKLGLVWDFTNMWTKTGESPAQVYNRLKKYIRHTHIKDARVENENLQYTPVGEGQVPIFEAIDLLSDGNYSGYYSFEWEKLWHPELAEPETVLAAYPSIMQKHFK